MARKPRSSTGRAGDCATFSCWVSTGYRKRPTHGSRRQASQSGSCHLRRMNPKASVCSAAVYAESIKLQVYDKSPMEQQCYLRSVQGQRGYQDKWSSSTALPRIDPLANACDQTKSCRHDALISASSPDPHIASWLSAGSRRSG